MGTTLRAFLMLRSAGDWEVSVFHDLEGLIQAWERRADTSATAIVHIGFDRSPSRLYDGVADDFPGSVLLTSAAKYALPKQFKSTDLPVGESLAGEVYLGTLGWGYDSTDFEPLRPATPVPEMALHGWVSDFVASNTEAKEHLFAVGIFDEPGYLEREGNLSHQLRHKVGLYRYRSFSKRFDDPCDIAKAAPPWLREREFSQLPLTVRLSNLFVNLGIERVADLDRFTTAELLRTPNCGKKSVRDLINILESALNAGPVDREKAITAAEEIGLIAAVRRSLLNCGPRERDIVASRMGLDDAPQTLHQIGVRYNITRERIRQIEAKTLRRLLAVELWDDLLASKLRQLLSEREYPLPLRGIEAVDPWFADVGERAEVVRYLLASVPEAGAALVVIDGLEYVALIDQDRWEAVLQGARKLLAGAVDKELTAVSCRNLVEGLLPEQAREFRSLLWAKSSKLCHFVSRNGESYLAQYGRGAEQVVQALLEESATPLHFNEIAVRASAKAGREIDPRRAHNAASNVGYLFGRGIYGLPRHLPFDSDQMQTISEIAEDIVGQSEIERQWHCSELLPAVLERVSLGVTFDKYVVDIALRNSGNLQRHGRMVWSRTGSGDDTMRIDIRQATIATLQNAGRPLRASDIRQRLIAARGLSQHFQIQQADPLVRVGPAIWGLNDRDVPIKRIDQPALVERLVSLLESRAVGVHLTEVGDEIPLPANMLPEAVFSVGTLDSRLRVNVGQYLYLAQWGEARRLTVQEAVRSMFATDEGPMSFDAIVQRVEEKVGRRPDRTAVSASLQSLGADFDGVSSWRLGTSRSNEDDDDIDAAGESAAA